MKTRVIILVLGLVLVNLGGGQKAAAQDASPPVNPVKLIFIHHSCGANWLADDNGGLGMALWANNYFVSDASYDWGPNSIGSNTDIGHWWDWFQGPDSSTYLTSLYTESGQNSSYSRMATDPGGENQIIMFKSCFPNSNLGGSPADPPTTGSNPLRSQSYYSEYMTVANAKGIYQDLLEYFATRQDKLFIAVTAPPLSADDTDAASAANARAFNDWLVNDWLDAYAYDNVAVFDFYNVLTSNGGDTSTNDLGSATGNHHRWRNNAEEHLQTVASNVSAYRTAVDDSHPTAAGNQKASGEFVSLLNYYYNRWQANASTTSNAYTFTYTYGDGDYYSGTVYAATGYGYSTGYTLSTTDEKGNTGAYAITGVTSGYAANLAGQVYVTGYYDAGSAHTYTPVGSGAAVGASYLTSEHDYIILAGVPEFYFGGGYYEADLGGYSRYDFNYCYNNSSGDYYTGYVYAPTSFQAGDLQFAVGKRLYDQPLPFWSQGYKSLGGAYYEITGITDGYAATYDKQSYITAYYDHDTAGAGLGVNSDGSTTAANIHVANRTAAWETGYAFSGSNHANFSPYVEADVPLAAASPTLASSAPPPVFTNRRATQTQVFWSAYWSQTASRLEEEQ